MALTKVSKLDKYEIVNADTIPVIQCRHAVWVEEDGVMIGGKQYHRHVIAPDTDVSNEDAQIQAVASAIFTDEIKAAYAAKLTEETV